MLVSVLLARDTPLPLAVGLFGDWGSGKSFFMAMMQERMAELAELAGRGRPEAAPFCREIRQIRFNAWHYVDTDLWSSLASTLFDELAGAGAPGETQAKLSELDQARERELTARTDRERLEREARSLQEAVERPTRVVRSSVAVAIRAVRADPDLRSTLRAAATAEGGVDASTDALVTALGAAEGTAHRARTLWRLVEEELLHRRPWVTLVTLAVLLAVAVAVSVLTQWPAAVKVVGFVGAMLAALTPALDGALRVLYLARDAREARESPLLEKRAELNRAQLAEDAAAREVTRRERELDELRDKGLQLQNYVRERAASSDYRAQLGVISKVRRDFEQLVALVPGDRTAPGVHEVAAAAAEVTRRVPQVERIFLFVDDLDRCPPEKVVEVLQAVHLLLAFKLFVVVVGVDSRWLERSLRVHYRNLLDQPDNYLEKIFQIPFSLRRMTASHYRHLIDQLTPSGPGERPDPTPGHAADAAKGAAPAAPDRPDADPTDRPDPAGEQVRATPDPPPLPRPEALVITEAERGLLAQLGEIVSTPRAAKRLVNIYRMLRVSVTHDELDAFSPTGGREYQAVIVLLGVMVGRPMLAERVLTAISRADDSDDVWPVLARFSEVGDRLAALRPHVTLDRAAPYRRWAPRVSRFSFRLAAVLPVNETPTPAGPD